MAQLIIAALMWTLVIVLVVFRRANKERSVLYAAILIALSMMMSIDPLYLVVDGWFGGGDITHLPSCLALMVGVFFLARGVARAGHMQSKWSHLALGPVTLIVACVVVSVAFFLVERGPETTVSFGAAYGTQLAAGVYSAAQYVYLGIVVSAMALTALRQLQGSTRGREKVSAWLLLAGSVAAIALCLDIVAINAAGVAQNQALLSGALVFYTPLQIVTFVFLTFGLMAAPLIRWARYARRQRVLSTNLDRIDDLWKTATVARPSIADRIATPSSEPSTRLHRRVVEIRDAALDNRNDFHLTPEDRALLAEVEDHLMAGTI
ncbi:DUF6545 domain-containing protein [Microbacterium sp. 77mftsu3.1]|uniref:DUF6545 domain-containing protein n=1 Tax=Microbacterium sp. 77mftsu3.1 TaxID=1761802 RepID=UPI00036D9185|nr:DUF6545 domain-containing protein [Microbacterium sp. 77mftsu3.1]SDH54828.1 hypothetical protein SAMN04488590_3542 [Microbacterium sp. 77mftsu3.1]